MTMRRLASRLPLRHRGVAMVAALMLAGIASIAGPAGPARAQGPVAGTPLVVSLGDSYISGEAGRWAGNTSQLLSSLLIVSSLFPPANDALGPAAYYDNPTGEEIPGCHRSRSAEVFIDGGINGKNLACSGARTASFVQGNLFKPGIDFYSDSSGRQGQALMLQDFAAGNNVKLVVLSIGGNNFNFGSIVATCVLDFLKPYQDLCQDDPSIAANFTAENIALQTVAISNAIGNVHAAMAAAGYDDSDYTILVQDYPSPIPGGAGFRYPESGLLGLGRYSRYYTGGCAFWNADADWANSTLLPTVNNAVKAAAVQAGLSNVRVMELEGAFNGRRLCENTVGLLEEKGLASWTDPGAVDETEWIQQIRILTTLGTPYFTQESLHPDYWAQLALRNCLRQAYNGGSPRGGTCTIAGTGLVGNEPVMALRTPQ
jgi:hypothetical protein